jgi:hypothetical protein
LAASGIEAASYLAGRPSGLFDGLPRAGIISSLGRKYLNGYASPVRTATSFQYWNIGLGWHIDYRWRFVICHICNLQIAQIGFPDGKVTVIDHAYLMRVFIK